MDLHQSKSPFEDADKMSCSTSSEIKKCCTDCKTTKTPLWRAGPSGPKSLCNACGIRYRKTRNVMMGLHKTPFKKRKRSNFSITTNTASGGNGSEYKESLKKMRLIVVGNTMLFQRSKVVRKQRRQRRRKLGEEEQQAAFSLMALSCGSVVA